MIIGSNSTLTYKEEYASSFLTLPHFKFVSNQVSVKNPCSFNLLGFNTFDMANFKTLFLILLSSIAQAAPLDTGLATLEARDSTCSNGGEPLCCQATVAGDMPLIISLAELAGVPLDPNDVNCIEGTNCPYPFSC